MAGQYSVAHTMSPSAMPNLSWMILARGARQLVVQEALLYRESHTLTKNKQGPNTYDLTTIPTAHCANTALWIDAYKL